MAEVLLLASADRDLHHALLDHDLYLRATGDRFIDMIAKTLQQLQDWPETGRLLESLPVRKLRFGSSNFAFLYDYDGQIVRIARIVDLRSDMRGWIP